MAPLGGLFATQRCHRVETERGRCDRYVVDVRFRRSASARAGVAPRPATRVVRPNSATKTYLATPPHRRKPCGLAVGWGLAAAEAREATAADHLNRGVRVI